MASIQKKTTKDGNTVYRVVVSVSRSGGVDGKRIQKTTVFHPDPKKTKRENDKALKAFADEFERKCIDGSIVGDETLFRDYATQWLKNYASKNVARTTYKKYSDQLNLVLIPKMGHHAVSDLKPAVIANVLDDIQKNGYHYENREGKYSAASLRDFKATLSTVCTSAVLDGLLASNPCTAAKQRTRKAIEKKSPKSFSIDEAMLFLDLIEKPIKVISPAHTVKRNGKIVQIREYVSNVYTLALRYRTAFTLIIFAGLRREEVSGLEWRDVDFSDGSINIERAAVFIDGEIVIKTPKSAAGYRKIYLPDVVMKKLKELKRETLTNMMMLGTAWNAPRDIELNPVFSRSEGGRMHPQTLNKELGRIIKSHNSQCVNDANKLPNITLHQLRHTSASILIAQGMEPTAVAQRLGHSDASITLSIYAHSFEERDRAAANALESALIHDKKHTAVV